MLGLNDMKTGGKGKPLSLPAPRGFSTGSLPVPISITTGWLHVLLACGVDDVFLCGLICQYGTINFVPPLFQNRFIVWKYIYIYICMYLQLYIFGNEQLLLMEIVVSVLSDYFRFQPGHLSHSSIYQTVSGFQVIRNLLRVAWSVIDGDPPMWF